MRWLYLRFVIGAVCALCVVTVAALTLGVALPIALGTIESNSVAAVTHLGRAAASNINSIFASQERQVVNAAGRPRAFRDGATLPTDDPSYDDVTGGAPLRKLLGEVHAISRVAGFGYFVAEYSTFDGVTCTAFTPFLLPTRPFAVRCALAPNKSASAATDTAAGAWFSAALPPHAMFVDKRNTSRNQVLYTFDSTAGEPMAAGLPEVLTVIPPGLPSLQDPSYKRRWDAVLRDGPPGAGVWSRPLVFNGAGLDFLLIAVGCYVRNMTGPLGVVGVFSDFRFLGGALDQARLTTGSEAFVFDRDLFLVAATSGLRTFDAAPHDPTDIQLTNRTLAMTPPGQEHLACATTHDSSDFFASSERRRVCRYHLTQAPHQGLRKAARSGPHHFAAHPVVGTSHLVAGHFVFTQRIGAVAHGFRMSLAVVTPEQDLIGEARRILPITLGVTVAAVVLAAAAAFLLVWLVLRPLGTVAVRMGLAARLEEDHADDTLSPLVEVADLQRAFVEMRDELSRIRAFIPQSLLRARDLTSSEEDACAAFDDDDSEAFSAVTEDSPQPQAAVEADATSPPEAGLSRSRRSGTPVAPSPSSGKPIKAAAEPTAARGLNLAAGMRRELVTVLVVNLRGFHGAADGGVDDEAVAAIVEGILRIAQHEKGIVESFHGDRFLISFNAVRPAAGHPIRAAKVACRVAGFLSGAAVEQPLSPTLRRDGELGASVRDALPNRYALPMTAGIASGAAQVSNLGSAAMKRFSIVGVAVSQAAVLERLCKLYGASCLVTQRLFDDLHTAVSLRTVGYVELPALRRVPASAPAGPSCPPLLGSPSPPHAKHVTAVLIARLEREHATVADDEWMYQLQQGGGHVSDAAAIAAHNAAWVDLVGGDVDVAQKRIAALPAVAETSASNAWCDDGTFGTPTAALARAIAAAIDRVQQRLSPPALPTNLGPFYKAFTHL